MSVLYTNIAVGALPVIIVYLFYRRYANRPFAHIPGPAAESFLLGNLRELLQLQAGETDCKWQEQFGGIVRVHSVLGTTQLSVSDPKALQYILQTSGYNFRKPVHLVALLSLLTGRGLVWANGDVHKRQRKVMLPAFGVPETKALWPVFQRTASQITSKWTEMIGSSRKESHVINVSEWLARGTLDALGEAAFDYNFGAVNQADNVLAKAYASILANMFGASTSFAIFTLFGLRYLPASFAEWFVNSSPNSRLQPARSARDVATRIAKELVNEKTDTALQGTSRKDFMSILVQSNLGQNPRGKVTDDEMYDQMRTLIIAGHDTTANALSWALFELAKNPDVQKKLRDEIRATESVARERGEYEITIQDFEGMSYTTAFMKEVLRLYPIGHLMYREAVKDEIIPLSKPLVTARGDVLYNVHTPKGTGLILSVTAYNTNKDLWGQDAYDFRPDRWLDGSLGKNATQSPVGVYGNLMTFSTGLRSCIGWRFALLEIQAFIVEFVAKFDFSMAVDPRLIRRENCTVIVPTVEGEVEKGAQLPLRVKLISTAE